MFDEMHLHYPVSLTGNEFAPGGQLKPVTYSHLIQAVAERHLNALQLDNASMAAQGVAWVLAGMTIDIQNPAPKAAQLIGTTWMSLNKPPYFQREFSFCDETGCSIFCGTTFSVVMELATRHVLRRYTLSPEFGTGNGIFALADVRPVFRPRVDYTPLCTRPVYRSDLDMLGHVNNTRYCEFAFDALTAGEAARPLRRMAINFSAELRLEEQVSLLRGSEEHTVYIKGTRSSDGKKSFDVAFTFHA